MADHLEMTMDFKGSEDLAKIQKYLRQVSADVQDLKDPFEQIGTHVIRIFSGQVFASQGGFINEPWPRLSDAYAVKKAEDYAGRPPMIREGDMINSFTKTVGPLSVTIGNSDPKFKYHQSSAPRKKIPRRAMIGIYNGMQDDVVKFIANGLSRKIQQRGTI